MMKKYKASTISFLLCYLCICLSFTTSLYLSFRPPSAVKSKTLLLQSNSFTSSSSSPSSPKAASTSSTPSLSATSQTVDEDLLSSEYISMTPSFFSLEGQACSQDNCMIPFHFNNCSSIAFSGPSSHQMKLKWTKLPRKVLLLCKPDPETIAAQKDAMTSLLKRGLIVVVEDDVYDKLNEHAVNVINEYNDKNNNNNVVKAKALPIPSLERWNNYQNKTNSIDMVIAFGGDGLLMHANTLFQCSKGIPPTMCFDFGSLGFLAPFSYKNFELEVDNVFTQSICLTLRMRLQCTIYRNNQPDETFYVLNEAVLDRGPSPFLAMIDIDCDNQYLTTVQGDGLIIATPTGSTAYSLAAGGSMVHPSVPAILLTPICAHSLSFRPLLLPDSSLLTCTVPHDSRGNLWASFDGKHRKELFKGDRLEIKMSAYPMPTVNRLNFTGDWFDALRSGFMFNLRGARQKNLNLCDDGA